MFSHILITLDGSAYGERVLAYAADLAGLSSARVTLLTVVESDGAEAEAVAVDRCRTYLGDHVAALASAGLEGVETEVRTGPAAATIAEAARELGVDLIAMSTQGVSAASDEGLGSIASRVLRSAPCPVFMVRVRRPAPPKGVSEERWQSEGGRNVG